MSCALTFLSCTIETNEDVCNVSALIRARLGTEWLRNACFGENGLLTK